MKRTISTILALVMFVGILAGIPVSAADAFSFTGSWTVTLKPGQTFPHDLGVVTLTQNGMTVTGTCSNYPNLTLESYFVDMDAKWMNSNYEDITQSIKGQLTLSISPDGVNGDGNLITHDEPFTFESFVSANVSITRTSGGAPAQPTPAPQQPEQPTPTPQQPEQPAPTPQQPTTPTAPAQNLPPAEPALTGFTATPSKTSFSMNGASVSVTQAYMINGNNYLQLRAIADLLKGTPAQFNVSWDGTYAVIETGRPYAEGPTSAAMQTTTDVKTSNTLFKLDGRIVSLDNAYLIDGSTNYLQLREVAKLLRGTASQFNVWWDDVKSVALIEPGKSYTGNYQSQAFSVTPYDGVTISGAEGALGADRMWTVREPTDAEFNKALGALDEANTLIIAAYKIDAGLGDGEKLPAPVEMRFDLSKMDIPADAYGDLGVYRIGDNGSVTELPSKVAGGALVCETRQNSVIVIATAVIAVFVGKEITDARKWGNLMEPVTVGRDTFNAFLGVEILDDEEEVRCKVYWSAANSPMFIEQVKTMQEEYAPIKAAADAKFGNPGSWNVIARKLKDRAILSDLRINPLYCEAKSNLLSKTWVYGNCTTPEVKNTIDAVEAAMKYLDYKYITDVSSVTDVLIKKNLGVLGASVNPPERPPYIEIDEDEAGDRDSLFLTVAHEMLHVRQTAYTMVEWASDVTFWEMTAIHFESNCRDNYRSNFRINGMPTLTESDWHETLVTPFDDMPSYGAGSDARNMNAIHHGYVLGRFLLFLEKNKGMAFETRDLLSAYRDERKAAAAVRAALDLTVSQFEALYLEFIKFEQSDIVGRANGGKADAYVAMGVRDVTLPADGSVEVPLVGGAYSAYVRTITFADPSQPVTFQTPQGLRLFINGEWVGAGDTTFTPTAPTMTIIEVPTVNVSRLENPNANVPNMTTLSYRLFQARDQLLQQGSLKMEVEVTSVSNNKEAGNLAWLNIHFTGFNLSEYEYTYTVMGETKKGYRCWIEYDYTYYNRGKNEFEGRSRVEKDMNIDREWFDTWNYTYPSDVMVTSFENVKAASTIKVRVYNMNQDKTRGDLKATFTYTVPAG